MANNKPVILEVGAGNNTHGGWVSLDYAFDAYEYKRRGRPDINHNLMSDDPLPLSSGSVAAIYTEHCLEHITSQKAGDVLKEFHRILSPGGVLRMAVPDADLLCEYYRGGTLKKHAVNKYWQKNTDEINLISMLATPLAERIPAVNLRALVAASMRFPTHESMRIIYGYMLEISKAQQEKSPGSHISWWNFDKARQALEIAGFRKIRKGESGDSRFPEFKSARIDTTAPTITLYVECAK